MRARANFETGRVFRCDLEIAGKERVSIERRRKKKKRALKPKDASA